MTQRGKSLTTFLLVGILAVGGVACGSSSDSSDSKSSSGSVTEWCNTWQEFESTEDEKIDAVTPRLEAYVQDVCGIETD